MAFCLIRILIVQKYRNKYALTKDLQAFDFNGKNFQIFISDYAIKNMIYTLYVSDILKL